MKTIKFYDSDMTTKVTKAADEALRQLLAMTDEELFAALENTDSAIAYAKHPELFSGEETND